MISRKETPPNPSASAVTDTEGMLRNIVQDQEEMIVRWKPGGIRIFVNRAYCEALNEREENLIGTSFYDKFDPEELREIMDKLESITPETPVVSKVLRMKNRGGKVAYQDWSCRGIFDENGRVVEYQCVGRDVTQRVLEEKASQENEKLRSLIIYNSTSDMMGLIEVGPGDSFVFVSFNAAARRFFEGNNIPQEYYLNADLTTYLQKTLKLDKSQLSDIIQIHRSVRDGKKPFTVENIFLLANGKTVYIETTLTPVLNNVHQCTHMLCISRDVTEKKKSELALKKAFEEVSALKKKLELENTYLKEERNLDRRHEKIIYGCKPLLKVLNKVEQVAKTDATVLITGETGTGKELIAEAIHKNSLRKDKPYVKVNCATLPANLVESELFGHEKGAFTGADRIRLGKFELSDGGTLFLDEIGEMPRDLQSKLLRVLQDGEFDRLGGSQPIKVNARIIAATNRNLEEDVKAGHFRRDLFFRLNVFPIETPPLRDRRDDIPILVEFFSKKYGAKYKKDIQYISDHALQNMRRYEWPGNVRELENIVERAVITADEGKLSLPEFEPSENSSSQQYNKVGSRDARLETVERNHIQTVLEDSDWVIEGATGAANRLGIKPSTLRDKMKKLRIHRS